MALLLLLALVLPVPEGGWARLADALGQEAATLHADGRLTIGTITLKTDPREARATQAFLTAWRATADRDQLYVWMVSASRLARRVANAEIRRRHIEPSPGQLERLIGVLRDPGGSDEDRHDALRTLRAVAGQVGADRLAQAFSTLPNDGWRLRAVGVLARAPSATTRRALLACARVDNDLLQRRCIAALEPERPRRAP